MLLTLATFQLLTRRAAALVHERWTVPGSRCSLRPEVRDWLDDETGVGEASVYETKQNDLELKVMEVTKEIRARKAAEAAAKKAAEEAAEAAKAEKAAGEL